MEHHFTVPVPVDRAWEVLLDLETIAPCMPGATLTGVDGDTFTGTVKVRLGPVSLFYKGSGRFVETDAATRRVVVEASGRDTRGNGTASATVTATLADDGGRTAVTVVTDLAITGRPAQLGRGLISEVAGKLLESFADCLAARLTSERGPGVTGVPETVAGPEAAEAPPEPQPETATGSAAEPDRPGPALASPAGAGEAAGARRPASVVEADRFPAPRGHDEGRAVTADRPQPEEAEPIDLLGLAGGPVAKRLVPLAAVVGTILFIVALLRRRRR
ncbi:MAG TPA: SRPBCC family protein [Pseudonocardiaceae bacterium]